MQEQKRQIVYSILMGLLCGLVLVMSFVAGFLAHEWMNQSAPISAISTDVNQAGFPLLDEVKAYVERVYLKEQPNYIQQQYAAIRGYLAALEDPYTFFIEPPVAANEADALAGVYGGIGVQIRRNEKGEMVLYPYPDSPVLKNDIREGAILIAIDGIELDLSLSNDDIDRQLRGEVKEGSGVEITVLQDEEEKTVFIEFGLIEVPSVLYHLDEDNPTLGYVQIIRFTSRTPDELEAAVSALLDEGVEALILDLRNNSGGLLLESVEVASVFLDDQVVTYEQSRDKETPLYASKGGLAIDIPLVVLVNGRTASASELVAGAIRDNDRGIVIGQTTYGKGTVQQIYPISDGSSVHITSAEWFTPDHTPINGVGLVPNIAMIPAEDGRDVEYGEAVRYLLEILNQEGSLENE